MFCNFILLKWFFGSWLRSLPLHTGSGNTKLVTTIRMMNIFFFSFIPLRAVTWAAGIILALYGALRLTGQRQIMNPAGTSSFDVAPHISKGPETSGDGGTPAGICRPLGSCPLNVPIQSLRLLWWRRSLGGRASQCVPGSHLAARLHLLSYLTLLISRCFSTLCFSKTQGTYVWTTQHLRR